MWLMTQFGFFSIVQKPNEPHLTILSRTRGDLDRLRHHYLPELGPSLAHSGSDYPWRATAQHHEVADAFKRIAEDISYPNFKDEIADSLGKSRANRYSQVWSMLADIPEDLPEPSLTRPDGLPWGVLPSPGKSLAYGGIVIDSAGYLLLREVANHFDGYVWTFAKGRPDPGETPRETALREVEEETGITARILCPIPGEFTGGTSINRYFLMVTTERDCNTNFSNKETARLRWANVDEARQLIGETTNSTGRQRDFAVLDAALACLPSPVHQGCRITLRENWKTRPMPARRSTAQFDLEVTIAEMARIYQGITPSAMEEKWFLFFEDCILHCHRSWTGYCIYRIHFEYNINGWIAKTVEMNRHPGQYGETDDQADLRQATSLIQELLLKSR
ncbi:ADP-ribose pyrophosphatase YjhB (NUDIX family) [Fluviicoccus keumensis]|uniref:ADP-ribose pyrophosphatase YjhB (NUDIX family) n=1 Tax=Fluviicoccus keumensis TaxID=1435465 RepID=A0A4Q7ZAN3_9GAMM|nr:NUDIX domain-containing protein [Fluviicoccus keumensis]RZU47151.1 ADP-ribose pyrophosphatase YjhB (NUDIX family) [Fluviicoccus keumensis]